ncbi:MAG: hypothetical protein GQ544_07610 [Candidatus Aminicenantes bacterium]|nr:hypothetical protein [Candidatus Aminicenantes bacterium]
MNAFVQKVIANLAQSLLASLDDVPEKPEAVVFERQAGSGLEIKLGQQPLRMNDFVRRLTENVLKGVIVSLDDIPADPQNFTLTL